jgi:hypothetical protein
MPERIKFSITQADYDELVRLNNPAAGVTMQINLETGTTIIETKTPQQLVTEWWQSAGDRFGINWRTAKIDPDNRPLGFTAEPATKGELNVPA